MTRPFKYVLESGKCPAGQSWSTCLCAHMRGCVRTSPLMALPSCVCICRHKEHSVLISHSLGESSHGCAGYQAIVGHLNVAYLGHGLLLAEVSFLI